MARGRPLPVEVHWIIIRLQNILDTDAISVHTGVSLPINNRRRIHYIYATYYHLLCHYMLFMIYDYLCLLMPPINACDYALIECFGETLTLTTLAELARPEQKNRYAEMSYFGARSLLGAKPQVQGFQRYKNYSNRWRIRQDIRIASS